MHECPECWSICYCDLDDSNDCRDHGRCYHQCPPEKSYDVFDDAEDDTESGGSPSAAREG